ncbi:alanine--tRNA ligase [Candidatus Woesearchaeota archaeon]|nr:alanine--tRNA ligase [Candidatus Woesearchaeota archaeon]
MKSDKEIKKEFKLKASKEPDKYYAASVLKEEGFKRKKCSKCGTFFWSVVDDDACGDPSCSGGFRFIGNTPATKKLDYIGVWKEFASLFKKWGYTPINRYPVTARWRQDADFVQASIYDFQPYVVSGEVEPPANPLVVPQLCLRFNDIDNIGITGAHYSCFDMIGQHAFMKPSEWSQARHFRDIHNWLKQGLGLKNGEIKFHEDAWAGGGNFGPCMEFFSRGLELGNQVYMLYEVTPSGSKELSLKVLDMGMGHERNAWFTQGSPTSYETTFPTVVEKLKKATGIKIDSELMRKFLPYSSYLNIDEVEDIDKTWNLVAEKTGYNVEELKKQILESAALYSIAEHSRALLVALSDGALPSNVGGGYNLRVLFRRAMSLMDKYSWKIEFNELCNLHAQYLKPLYPELSENLNEVNEILNVEKRKYGQTKQKTQSIISKLIKEEINEKKLLTLYDSQGIAPELVKEEAEKMGKKIKVPDNFYALVSEMHEKQGQEHETKREEKLDLEGLQETEALYYDDPFKTESKGKVLKIIGNNVILDKTVAYPTSGGQLHDTGKISDEELTDIFKQGNIIVHVLKNKPSFKVGDIVAVEIDKERRKQLAQHHTATHIVGTAARKVLGNHINQAGAKKTREKATLDITHYQSLSDEETKKIESEANKIVNSKTEIIKKFYPRTEAEKKFGMNIYQGGAVPGKNLRIVQIKGLDTQACGGTHLNNTSEAGKIKILKSTKISDSIVRIEFTAGKAAEKELEEKNKILEEAEKLLDVGVNELPSRVQELFNVWKKARKAAKKGIKLTKEDLKLAKKVTFKGDVLAEISKTLQTQPEHITKTIKRFLEELEEMKGKIK